MSEPMVWRPVKTRDLYLKDGDLERFESLCMPEPNTGCWIWLGALRPNGYGEVFTGSKADGTNYPAQAHRVAYILHRGPIPTGLVLDHLCRHRWCVNPWHLEIVTSRENVRRGHAGLHSSIRSLARTHCQRGHELTPGNILIRSGAKKSCLACSNIRGRNHKRGKALANISIARQRLAVRSLLYNARTKRGRSEYAEMRGFTPQEAMDSLLVMRAVLDSLTLAQRRHNDGTLDETTKTPADAKAPEDSPLPGQGG